MGQHRSLQGNCLLAKAAALLARQQNLYILIANWGSGFHNTTGLAAPNFTSMIVFVKSKYYSSS